MEAERKASAGCAGCGDCCTQIHITSPIGDLTAKRDGWVSVAGRYWRGRMRPPAGRMARDAAFILKWMRPTGDVVRVGTEVRQVWTCDAFDPHTRRCTQHAARPQMCSDYPWYGREPTTTALREKHCSYWADVPAADRPEGVRPLIPLTVLHHPEV